MREQRFLAVGADLADRACHSSRSGNGIRNIVLAAAVLLHVALLLAWRPLTVAKPGAVGLGTSLYLLTPPRKPAPSQSLGSVSKSRAAAQAARVNTVPAPAVPEPAAITLEQPTDALANVDEQPGASVRTTGNGPGAGRDPFRDAGKQMVVNCPARGPLGDYFVRRKKKSGQ